MNMQSVAVSAEAAAAAVVLAAAVAEFAGNRDLQET